MPPTSKSATSVVVTSITPATSPLSTSFSIDSPAGAGGVEDEAVVVGLERLGHRLDAGRRDAEHGEPDRGLVRRRRLRNGVPHHAGQRVRGVAQHPARDPVEPLHVGDRVHHADVGRTDIGRHVAGRHGRDQHLGHAHRQRAHRRRHQRGVAGAAGADHAADIVRPASQRSNATAMAATAAPRSSRPSTAPAPPDGGRDLGGGHVDAAARRPRAEVDRRAAARPRAADPAR